MNVQKAFESYIRQMFQNQKRLCASVSTTTYYFWIDLPEDIRAPLIEQNQEFFESNNLCVHPGQLLGVTTGKDPYPTLHLFGYSDPIQNCEKNNLFFNSLAFDIEGWPSDFDPRQYVTQATPLPWPPSATIQTDQPPVYMEQNNTLNPKKNASRSRIFLHPDEKCFNDTFINVGCQKIFRVSTDNTYGGENNTYFSVQYKTLGLSNNVESWMRLPLTPCPVID